MADRKRAASEEPTTSTGTRKSARVTAPVDVYKASAFDVAKSLKAANGEQVQPSVRSPKAGNDKQVQPTLESLKVENEDLVKRLAAAKKQSAAYAKLLIAEKEKGNKLRDNFMTKQDEMLKGLEEIHDNLKFCAQQ